MDVPGAHNGLIQTCFVERTPESTEQVHTRQQDLLRHSKTTDITTGLLRMMIPRMSVAPFGNLPLT